MNEIARRVRTTQAAEGQPRWRWTIEELLRLDELGAFSGEDRFELIGGEIVPMSPAGRRHEVIREDLENWLRKLDVPGVGIIAEPQFNLDEATYTKPDILVRPAEIRAYDVRGETALLVIEIATTTLSYDLGTKALTYAQHGVREYWVIDARTLVTTVHRAPDSGGYGEVSTVEPGQLMVPHLAAALAAPLADLAID